jgi:hypothetical protein
MDFQRRTIFLTVLECATDAVKVGTKLWVQAPLLVQVYLSLSDVVLVVRHRGW